MLKVKRVMYNNIYIGVILFFDSKELHVFKRNRSMGGICPQIHFKYIDLCNNVVFMIFFSFNFLHLIYHNTYITKMINIF